MPKSKPKRAKRKKKLKAYKVANRLTMVATSKKQAKKQWNQIMEALYENGT